MRVWRCNLVLFVACCGAAAPAAAQELPDSFLLSRYIPGDVWMVVHNVHNPQRGYIDEQWAEVWDAIKEARLDQDLLRMFSVDNDVDAQSGKTKLDQTYQLIGSVAWADLFAKESVFAERRAKSGVGYDYILMARGSDGSGADNFEGLVRIVGEVAPKVRGAIGMEIIQRRAAKDKLDVLAVGIKAPDARRPKFPLHLFRRGDIIGAVVGAPAFARVRALLTGNPTVGSLANRPRFRHALSEVGTPTDGMTFFDLKNFMGDMCSMCDAIRVTDKPGGESSRQPKRDVLRRLIAVGDVIDYVVSSQSTIGNRETTQTVVRLQSGKQHSELAKAFLDRTRFDRFDRFVPKDATSFSVSTTVDLERIYHLAMDVVARELPDGADRRAMIEGLPAKIGLDLQADLFDWLGGESVSVEMPAAVVSPMGGSDHVWMIRTKNPDLARTKTNELIDFAVRTLQSRGQMLSATPAENCPRGFRQIVHPMMAMFMKPVVGVYDKWLMIGTSQAAVSRCIAVAEGKAPSVRDNKRFQKEGVMPSGAVMAASFSDASKMGEQLSQSFAMGGMMGGMVSAQMGGKAPAEAQELVTNLLSLGTKLAPVVRKLDFYSSRSSVTTYDGGTKIESTSVTTYKTSEALDDRPH